MPTIEGVGDVGRVVTLHQLRLVDKDGIAAVYDDPVVACARVDPHRLLHRRADGDLVVAGQRIDQDDVEVAFRRQQLA